jgi:hypothetical protein
MEENPDE